MVFRIIHKGRLLQTGLEKRNWWSWIIQLYESLQDQTAPLGYAYYFVYKHGGGMLFRKRNNSYKIRYVGVTCGFLHGFRHSTGGKKCNYAKFPFCSLSHMWTVPPRKYRSWYCWRVRTSFIKNTTGRKLFCCICILFVQRYFGIF